jgi:hypothetical protein
MAKTRRYWTQFGFTEDQTAVNSDDFMKKTAPWSGITQCYMQDIIRKSSIFQTYESYFFNESSMKCTLLTSNKYDFKYSFAREHYLGFYFDHELK